ncbi:hypothetical protein MNR01_09355 [Lysobacter sp. S4-A87]|uniref:hypothetical protein n=1 Tax=Lysobacter sp. S4-A87 TaxID=2925843 RepID=UPI001F535D79|nr:hypothetical protein [Lysobacter sp. S4-A87]UNK47998.1 hypothetical protein MNR01_09355 [Lysobacter sp. S4-A87]
MGERERFYEALCGFIGFTPVPLIDAHVELIREIRFDWMPTDSGAPCVNPITPLHLDEDGFASLRRMTTLQEEGQRLRLFLEAVFALPEFVEKATLVPGDYHLPRDIAEFLDVPRSGMAGDCFRFTGEHLKLLKAASWRTRQVFSPLPYIAPRRPYGDFTDVPMDAALVLGWRRSYSDLHTEPLEPLSGSERALLAELHYQTLPAIHAFVRYAKV